MANLVLIDNNSDITEIIRTEEYFDVLEKKEAIENKLLNTFSVPTKAVTCKACKYIALSQSDYCKGTFSLKIFYISKL